MVSAPQHLYTCLSEFRSRSTRAPIDYIRLLPSQLQVVSDTSRYRLFRGGSQSVGKTTIGLCEVIWRCLGTHPYQPVTTPPIEAWVLCASWSQSIAIQAKFYELVDKAELSDDCVFDPVSGFRGKNPTAKFRNGSIVRFKTSQQSGLDLAGATIDFALFDEPPSNSRVYQEVKTRVQAKAGKVLLTLTPVNVDCSWLKELAENGTVKDIHCRLSPSELIPVGWHNPIRDKSGAACDAQWIDTIARSTLPHEVPVVVHGEWEFRTVDAVFSASFRRNIHVQRRSIVGDYTLQIGFDWGSGSKFSQYAVLVAIQTDKNNVHHVHVLDEYVAPHATTTKQDAIAVAEMLRRWNVKWQDLSKAYGDRVHMSGSVEQKSNTDFIVQLERVLGIRAGSLRPTIETVKRGTGKGAGSVHTGCKYLNDKLLSSEFTIAPHCTRIIECLEKWDMSDNEYKHAIDALRYCLDNYIFSVTKKPIVPIHI